jgi:hypothetical protein
MTTTAGPFPDRQPSLVAGQPVAGPRHDRVGDEVIRRPFIGRRVVNAKGGPLGAVVPPINVRNELPGGGMFEFQRRVQKRHFREISVRDFQIPKPVPAHILDADRIGTVRRPDWAGPGCPPAAMFRMAQRREPLAHAPDLLRHGQPGHSRERPKKVCGRVTVAAAGTANPDARTRPLPGRCMLRPEAML